MHKEENTSPGSTHCTYSGYTSSIICYYGLPDYRKGNGIWNILVINDHFTKFAQAYPAKNQKAVTTAKLVLDFIRRYGFPERFHSDQGQNFVGKVMKNLYKLTGIKQTKTTPYHPMGNGLSERFNRTLLSMVGTLTSEKKAWPTTHLHMIRQVFHHTFWCLVDNLDFQ